MTPDGGGGEGNAGGCVSQVACGWKRSGQLICCLNSLTKFAEGGSKFIAIFHWETPVIATVPLPNTTTVPSDAKSV